MSEAETAHVKFKLDFDWQYYDGMNADATIEVDESLNDKEAEEAILAANSEVGYASGNDHVTFIPYKVNGIPPSWKLNKYGGPEAVDYPCMHPESRGNRTIDWITEACIDHLKRFPNTRIFKMEGVIE